MTEIRDCRCLYLLLTRNTNNFQVDRWVVSEANQVPNDKLMSLRTEVRQMLHSVSTIRHSDKPEIRVATTLKKKFNTSALTATRCPSAPNVSFLAHTKVTM